MKLLWHTETSGCIAASDILITSLFDNLLTPVEGVWLSLTGLFKFVATSKGSLQHCKCMAAYSRNTSVAGFMEDKHWQQSKSHKQSESDIRSTECEVKGFVNFLQPIDWVNY
jgi:hypothetical protein